MLPPIYDLFGEIPVSESDVHAWVEAIAPAYLSSERSFRSYVKNYDVPAKIRHAKLRGQFEQFTAKPLGAYHVRLALTAIL